MRVNWQALHLESAQKDYRLRLRLGLGFDYEALHATLAGGELVLTVPKKPADHAVAARSRRVA